MIVAIDGPAGAGKSTIARAVADRLGFDYVDTGALYRAVTLAALEAGTSLNDSEALAASARALPLRLDGARTFIGDRDVTQAIRTSDVTRAVSTVAADARVRAALVEIQRSFARRSNVVMEGRDIGSTIAPDAQVKVFLTASLDERARRRLEQLGMATDDATVADAARSIESRDRDDAEREASPLKRAPDAVVIDSTGKSIDDVVEEVAALAQRAGAADE